MRRMALALAVVATSACGATVGQLRTRASIDLECPEDRIGVKEVDSATRQVEGCGKSAVYVENFNDARYPTWTLNSAVHDVAAKTASP